MLKLEPSASNTLQPQPSGLELAPQESPTVNRGWFQPPPEVWNRTSSSCLSLLVPPVLVAWVEHLVLPFSSDYALPSPTVAQVRHRSRGLLVPVDLERTETSFRIRDADDPVCQGGPSDRGDAHGNDQ